MSENVEIQIDLKLNEEQAKEEMNSILSSMKELANSKANNINIKVNVDKNGLSDLAKVETAIKEINKLSADAQKALAKGASGSSAGMDKTLVTRRQQVSAFTKDLQKAEAQLAKLGKSGFVDQSQVTRLQQTLTSLKGIKLDNLKNMGDSSFKSAQAGAEQLLNSVKELNNVRLDGLKNANIGNFTTKISSDLDKIEAKFKQLGKSTTGIDQIRSQLSSLNTVAPDKLPSTFANIRNQVRGLNGELRQVNSQARQGSRFFGDLGATLRTFTLGNIIGDGIVRSIRGVTSAFLEMDKAMTDVIKVADSRDIDSTLKLDNIREQANGIAKEVGMASYDVLYGISDAIQQGMGNLNESIAVARSSLMLANVGDMSQEDASSAVATMVKGFQLQPLQAVTREVGTAVGEMDKMKVTSNELAVSMDALNFAGNNYAIGTDGVAEAMKRGGAVLHQYGVSLEDTVAMITASNESVQNPEKVGNGLKSIAINLSGMKANAKDGTLELNKTAMALKEIAGVDVYEDKKAGKVKNMVNILDEVKDKWSDLREDEQLAISEAIAGKHQAAIFQSLMSNYDNFRKLRGEFERGEHLGSAEAENSRYVNSIAGKLNELKQIWLSIGQTMVTSDFTKGMLDGLIKVSEVIETVVKNTKGLNVALLAIGVAVSRTMKAMKLTTSTTGASGMNFMNGLGMGKNGEAVSRVFGKVKTDIASATTAGQKFKATFTGAFSGMRTELAGVGTKIAGVGKMFAGMALQTVAIIAITMAIQKMAKAWDNYKNGLKNSEKDIRNSLESANSELKESQDNLRYLKDKQKRYEELIKKKKELSSIPFKDQTPEQIADMDELKNITFELAEMFPELVIGYDDNGLPMMIEDMDTLKQKMEEAIETKNQLAQFEKNKLADNLWKQWNVGEKDGTTKKDQLNNKQKEYDQYIEQAQNFREKFQKALSEGNIKGSFLETKMGTDAKGALERFKDYQEKAQEVYSQLKTDRETYMQEEREIQQKYTSNIFSSDSFKKMGDTGKEALKGIYDSVDWLKLSKPMQESMQLTIDKFAELGKTDEGQKQLQQWGKEIENANKVFQETGDLDSYNQKISDISKTISDATGIDASLLVEGFTNLPPVLNDSQMALQNFLSGYNKTLEDVRNKDSIAINLRDQFLAVDSALSEIMNDLDKSIKTHKDGQIELDLEVATNIANKSDMPKQISQLIKDLGADGSLKGGDTELILSVLAKFRDGDLEGLNEEIKSFFDGGGEKYQFKVGAELDPAEAEKVQQHLESLLGGDKGSKEYKLSIKYFGKKDAEAYTQFMDKMEKWGFDREISTKILLENQDALDGVKDYDEFIQRLKDNPEILQKYGLEVNGKDEIVELQEKMENTKDKKVKVKAETEGKDDVKDLEDNVDKVSTTIDSANGKTIEVKTGKENVLETIEDVEKLIDISSKVEDGKYKLEIDSNTENAVKSLKNLEDALAGLSGKMKGLSTSATIKIETASAIANLITLSFFIGNVKSALSTLQGKDVNINTAQSAQNLSGLITRVSQYTTAIDGVKDRDVNVNTAQSAKNLSGLIKKLVQYNATPVKSINIKTNASSVASQIGSVTKALSKMPSSKTVTIRQQSVGMAMGAKGFSSFSASSPSPQTFGASAPMPSFSAQSLPQPTEMLARSIVPKSLMTQASDSLSRTTTFANKTSALSNSVFSSLSKATLKTPISKGGADIEKALKYGINLLTELDYRIKTVTNSISLLDKRMKNASSSQKLKYLEEQTRLYHEQNSLLLEQQDILLRQRNNYKYNLERKGFKFNNDGNFTNYEEKMLALEKEVEDKDKALKKANDGKNENAKKKAQEAYDKAKDNLDEVKKLSDEYIKVNTQELPKVTEEWIDIGNSIADANEEQRKLKEELKQVGIDAYYVSLNKQVDQYKNSLSEIDVLLKNAHGSQKKLLLEQQKDIYGKQAVQLKRVKAEYEKEMGSVQKDLESWGFEFRDNGDIINYIQQLSKIKENHSDANFDYVSEKAQKYLDLLVDKIPALDKELLELSNDIFEVEWALRGVNREIALFGSTTHLKALETQFDKLADAIGLIDTQMKHAYGKDKLKLMQDKIDLLKEQAELQEQNISGYKEMAEVYQKDLGEFGFSFNKDGDITNLEEIYGKYKNNENFSKVKELVEEYLDIQRGKLPDAVKEWENLSSAIKDAYKEQLDITKEAEDKVTEIYKKQLEERKKLIEKELKAKTDAIKKEQEAYNKAREEAKYKDNYDEQLEKVQELQKKYEIAKKDTSLAGQKKLQDIMKELKEEQKKLQEMVQDKIDSDINDMFDEEQNRLEDNAEKQKELLDEEFSDKKIQELVKEALSTGVFEDIDGTMRSLQDVMLDFLDEYGDGMGATGELIKSEWITNLEIAKDTMKDIADISKEIISGGNIGISSTNNGISDAINSSLGGFKNKLSQLGDIIFKQPLINIEGNVDKDIFPQLQKEIKELENKIPQMLVDAIR